MATDLEKITPPRDLSDDQKKAVFNLFFRRLAQYRNSAVLHSDLESSVDRSKEKQGAFESEINLWAQHVLEKAWIVCQGEDEGESFMCNSRNCSDLLTIWIYSIVRRKVSKARSIRRHRYRRSGRTTYSREHGQNSKHDPVP